MAVAIGQPPRRRLLRTHPVPAGSILLLAGALVVSLLAALLRAGDNPVFPPAAPATVTVTEADAGSTVRLHSGDHLVVTLAGNPTTGYTWEIVACDAAVLTPLGEPEFVPDTAAPGSGGRVITRLAAVGPGQTTLQMIYHRTFEPGVPPLKTFALRTAVEREAR